MASSLVSNTNQVHFASVLAMDNAEMVAMFEALVASGLNGFRGCMSDISETALIEFYQNASVRDGQVLSTVHGKLVEIFEEIFSRAFQLPMEGLIDINEVPKDLIFDSRTEFSFTGELLSTSCKKRELKIEYRLLSDIVAKSITVKAGSFDAVTHERFLLMTAIFGGVSDNWGIFLFKIFKDMVTPETRQARGYDVHICTLLKNIPDLELGDSEEFPPLKILTAKTFGSYIAINDKIVIDNVEGLAGKSRVKKTPVKRAASKKRPAAAIEEQVMKKKKTLKGKAAPSKAKLELVSVELDAEPIQTVDPTSAVDVDTIIEQVIAESDQLDTDVGIPVAQKADEMEQWFNLSYEEYISSDANRRVETDSDTGGEPETVVVEQQVQRSVEKEKNANFGASEDLVLGKDTEGFLSTMPTDKDLMSLDDLLMQISDDMMLPSVTAAEVTKIKFGLTVEIHEVQDKDCLSQLLDLESVKVIAAKEKHMLNWTETTSLETVVKRRVYIIVKYKEMLLRIFLESHRKYFAPGKPWTSMASQIIDLLSAAHLQSLDALLEAHNDTNVLSLGLKAVRTQTAILTTNQADARKDAKEQKANIDDMDERLATLRSEQLDFCAQAQENYNNLSSQLGELVAYINRGNDKNGEESSSRRPQPPSDDPNRPSGGNASRGGGGGSSGGSG
ncbi:hypothetical protein F511_24373 [Dorcoceras hygrometricum]|uniref:Dystroglycan-like n=1 Tax=Dorcoceras hygrometricum TaxID=472368 RepID=A0A2Z7ARN9_9LAMI|nr:hypothetical protein F511_24373 [Dorcoceras hygrometricum]